MGRTPTRLCSSNWSLPGATEHRQPMTSSHILRRTNCEPYWASIVNILAYRNWYISGLELPRRWEGSDHGERSRSIFTFWYSLETALGQWLIEDLLHTFLHLQSPRLVTTAKVAQVCGILGGITATSPHHYSRVYPSTGGCEASTLCWKRVYGRTLMCSLTIKPWKICCKI